MEEYSNSNKLSDYYECNIKLDGNEWLSVKDYVEACKYRDFNNPKYMQMFRSYTAKFKKIKRYYDNLEKEKREYILDAVYTYSKKYPNLDEKSFEKNMDRDLVVENALAYFRWKKRKEAKEIENEEERNIAVAAVNHIEFVPQEDQKKELKPIENYNNIEKASYLISTFSKFTQSPELEKILLDLEEDNITDSDLIKIRNCIELFRKFDLKTISNFSSEYLNKIYESL